MARNLRSASLVGFLYPCVLAVLLGCAAQNSVESIPPYEIVEIVPGVYAAIANIGGTALSNAGIFDMGQVAIVYDTGLTPEAGEQLRVEAEELTGHRVAFVINSHFHDDHIGGNQSFSDASYVSTSATQRLVNEAGVSRSTEAIEESKKFLETLDANLRAEMDSTARRELTLMRGYILGIVEPGNDFRRVAPTVTWDHRLNFTDSLRAVKIVPVGVAHSEGDAVLLLKADSVLFTGDLVTTDRHPRMADGDPDGWMAALDTLLSFDFNVLVPGHGPIGDRQSVLTMRRYLEFVEQSAREASEGRPVDDIPIDSTFASWMLESQFRENVRFVMDFRKKN